MQRLGSEIGMNGDRIRIEVIERLEYVPGIGIADIRAFSVEFHGDLRRNIMDVAYRLLEGSEALAAVRRVESDVWLVRAHKIVRCINDGAVKGEDRFADSYEVLPAHDLGDFQVIAVQSDTHNIIGGPASFSSSWKLRFPIYSSFQRAVTAESCLDWACLWFNKETIK